MKLLVAAIISIFSITMFYSINTIALEDTMPAVQAEIEDSISLGVSSLVPDEENRYCRVLRPGSRDRIGRFCRNGYYGIVLDGYIVDNACFRTVNIAVERMRNTVACDILPPATNRYCQISNPSERDRARRLCDNGRYAYVYDGYIVDNSCFANIDQAIQTMDANPACSRQAREGRCEIAQPRVRDINNRYCDTTYGILYRGAILNNTCYRTLELAMDRMAGTIACR